MANPTRPLTLGVVMDPIASINPAKDSTLAMLRAAAARGHRLRYFELGDLWLRDGIARGHAREFLALDDPDRFHALGPPAEVALGDLDAILMRKDPPFDTEYIYSTYILERAALAGALVVNRPGSLRDINEKAFTAWFPECCPPTLVTRSIPAIRAFLEEHGRIVVKPLHGMGGRSIFVIAKGDPNANVVCETLTDYGTRYAMAQRYIPEIRQGDKRIILVEGRPVGYALARVPAPDDNRGNLVAGATPELRELTDRDRWICDRVGPVLRERGVLFAGLDVIGDYLTEVNVTSPTGIRELAKLGKLDVATDLVMAVERHCTAR